jgi:hypothetical protein
VTSGSTTGGRPGGHRGELPLVIQPGLLISRRRAWDRSRDRHRRNDPGRWRWPGSDPPIRPDRAIARAPDRERRSGRPSPTPGKAAGPDSAAGATRS